jgi:hypothetical protein
MEDGADSERRSEVADAAPARGGLSDPLTALALTLPIFVLYHLGVVLLPVQNAADWVTVWLRELSDQNLALYAGITLALGAAFAGVLLVLGRGQALRSERFVYAAIEGVIYAIAMRVAGAYVVGSLRLGPEDVPLGPFGGLVMALGAGFYEELAFRALLFGGGAFVLRRVVPGDVRPWLSVVAWAFATSVVFAGWHYVGALGEPFELRSFVFRGVCGLVLTVIYAFRGFAAAVWTHTLYDVWVLVW